MHWIDWAILIVPLLICCGIAIYSRRYVRSVADFMAGGRNAGRFLICTAKSEQGSGAVVFVATFQAFYVAGFGVSWWNNIGVPIALLTMVSGYVVYRYRQTRAMSLGQFFEMRYSRRFRLAAGVLGFVAGLANFGVIPVVGAHCMVYLMQLPTTVLIFSRVIPTHLILMAIFLTLCVLTTTTGGQVSVLLTDCAEGMFSQLFYTLIGVIVLISFFHWSATKAMLLDRPPTKSLVNPFDAFSIGDFNIWMVLAGIMTGNFYRTIAWQNSHAFNSSAATPHESRMGSILGRWRSFAVATMVTLLAVCAMTYIHDPVHAASVQHVLDQIPDPSTRDQMRLPTALSQFLPGGVKGMLLSICLLGIISGDGIHLHSWGSILIQDVIMPFRKKPFTPRQHLNLLRSSIVGVAVWAFFFGALFPQMKYVGFWWGVTEALFIGGAGIAIVGGLYWSRGTTAGAWTGLLVGFSMAAAGILADSYCNHVLPDGKDWIVHGLRLSHGHNLFINGWQIAFFTGVIACLSYWLVSLATCRGPHDMDRLLHRGKYAIKSDATSDPAVKKRSESRLNRLIGIDDQFNRMDRWITHGIFWWSMFWVFVFVVGTVGYLVHRHFSGWSDSSYNGIWASFYLITGIYLPLFVGALTTVWFTVGCWSDIWVFFRRLGEERVDDHDDGSVVHEEVIGAFESMQPIAVEPGVAGMATSDVIMP